MQKSPWSRFQSETKRRFGKCSESCKDFTHKFITTRVKQHLPEFQPPHMKAAGSSPCLITTSWTHHIKYTLRHVLHTLLFTLYTIFLSKHFPMQSGCWSLSTHEGQGKESSQLEDRTLLKDTSVVLWRCPGIPHPHQVVFLTGQKPLNPSIKDKVCCMLKTAKPVSSYQLLLYTLCSEAAKSFLQIWPVSTTRKYQTKHKVAWKLF